MLCGNFQKSNSSPVDEKTPTSEPDAILHAILEHSSDGIFIVEPVGGEFRFLLANQTYLKMQAIATPVSGKWLHQCLPEAIATTAHRHLTTCLQQQVPHSYQQPSETEVGPQLLLISLSPIFANSKIAKIAGTCQDLTERQRIRATDHLLQTIALSVAEAENFQAALTATLQKICQVTGWNYAEAWVPSTDPATLECSRAWYSSSPKLHPFHSQRKHRTFPATSNLGQIWSLEPLNWIPTDLPAPLDSLLDINMAIEAGFQAGLSIPILASGQILAVLVFFMKESRLESKYISLVSAVTVQLGAIVHHKKYRNIFENVVAGIYQTSLDGRYQTANPMLARIYGYDSPEELMTGVRDIAQQLYVNPNRHQEFQCILQAQDAAWGFESQVYRKDGSTIWISESGRAIHNEEGKLIGYEGTVEDITQRKLAEVELHKRDCLLQGVAEAMHHLLTDADHETGILKALATLGAVTDVERVYIYESHPHPDTSEPAVSLRFEWVKTPRESNPNRSDWQNVTPHSFGLQQWPNAMEASPAIADFIHSLPQEEREVLEREGLLSRLIVPIRVEQKLWGYLGFDEGGKKQPQLSLTGVSNPPNLAENSPVKRRWSEGEISILKAIGESIGGALQRHKIEEKIRYQALHDRLTGLPNRVLLTEKLTLALRSASHRGSQFALMFLDLDHFKVVNDTLGHAIGDLLLQSVVQRLNRCLREGDTIARWGGDEFIILLPHISRPKDAANVAQRILEILRPPFELDGHHLEIGSSIGIALYPIDGEDGETLMKKADAALYLAKESGRNNYQL